MAQAFTTPVIISREEWGAREPKSKPVPHEVKRLVLHHSWKPTIATYAGTATIRGIQDYHMDINGWADIGYHYLIGPAGEIFSGRDPEHVGAHCGNKPATNSVRRFGNTGSIGIMVVGNFDAEQMTDDQVVSLSQLIVWLQDRYKIPYTELYGHRECHDPPMRCKSCPGKNLVVEMLGRNSWEKIEREAR